ncbi:FAD-dependent oxidoreductase [Bradyrhizobium sp. NP1]|uniref:NAD(P)/FAD-dependent oxidoreductase n=1 Tax=Bradyrhizobium sp. NP1 TaxID=3049772 RepID=UPI0025A61B3E|nr:FAD-dependent oxidoreductase [Bradyrhizobium sp. NP1]WJR78223.1 FAD-dependent oxidoreductase [Bradyrhizobium sp. NP1]
MQDADVVVIGAGVAGLTAAAIAAKHGLSTLVIEQLAPGGQVATIENVQNFPGFPDGIAGYELGPLLQQQAEAAGALMQLDTVSAIAADGASYRVTCAGETIAARAVIIAAGSSLRKLGVSGESELTGRGVSHCAACDGPLFKGKPVVVAGGGDSAFDEAATLAGFASEILIVHRGPHPRARRPAVEQLAAKPDVTIMAEAEIATIHGATSVTGVDVRTRDGTLHKACSAVFGYVGLQPRTGWLDGFVATDTEGRIVTDAMMQTSRPGVFAAGDIRAGAVCLLAAAAGDAATAATAAAQYLHAGPQRSGENKTKRSPGGTAIADGERSRVASGG